MGRSVFNPGMETAKTALDCLPDMATQLRCCISSARACYATSIAILREKVRPLQLPAPSGIAACFRTAGRIAEASHMGPAVRMPTIHSPGESRNVRKKGQGFWFRPHLYVAVRAGVDPVSAPCTHPAGPSIGGSAFDVVHGCELRCHHAHGVLLCVSTLFGRKAFLLGRPAGRLFIHDDRLGLHHCGGYLPNAPLHIPGLFIFRSTSRRAGSAKRGAGALSSACLSDVSESHAAVSRCRKPPQHIQCRLGTAFLICSGRFGG